jgi:hypothetical protein
MGVAVPIAMEDLSLTRTPCYQPHPDGLATYRVYEDVTNESGLLLTENRRGEAIDIAVRKEVAPFFVVSPMLLTELPECPLPLLGWTNP